MLVLTGALIAFLLTTNLPAGAQEVHSYSLGEGDRLRLKVIGQPDLSDVFEIGEGGTLVLPGLGTLTGLNDLQQARSKVAELLDRNVGLSDTTFSLVVETWRPVIVGGNVSDPGEVKFRSGMRVAHAISLAGGQGRRAAEDLTVEFEINREKERFATAKERLARARMKERRLISELQAGQFSESNSDIAELVGAEQARALYDAEKRLFTARSQNKDLSLRRIAASTRINSEDITAQQSVSKSLSAQLELVRGDLARLQPLFEKGEITATRILELRRDYVEIEGQVGQSVASLAQARTRQVVLAEESTALDLQLRLEILGEIASIQFDIIDAQSAIESTTRSLEAAGLDPDANSASDGCGFTIIRDAGEARPMVIAAEQLTPLKPGDLLLVGKARRDCPSPTDAD